jgi:methylmalonyl-CoA mutase
MDQAPAHDSLDAAIANWRDQVLAGRPGASLDSTTFEGLRLAPLYPRATAETPRALRQEPGPWRIAQRIDQTDPGDANRAALEELRQGADALTLAVAGAQAARGHGIAIADEPDLFEALAGIDIERVPIRVDAGPRALEIASHLPRLAERRRLSGAALDADLGHDPIGQFACSGTVSATPKAIAGEAADILSSLHGRGFKGHLFLADSRPYHEAGAGEAQELACVIATGLAYLRMLADQGIGLEAARREIAFLLAADADEFLTLAKFRALRRLWSRIETACGLAPRPVRLHAETSFRMMTARDPWTNVFRATIAAFSAGAGGADRITVLPFTLATGLPDDFARRLARNIQLVLVHEAGIAKVADPGAGSGAFEALTQALCEKAWAMFQGIERTGGMFASLAAGLPQGEIAKTMAARQAAIAEGRLAITGTSLFPSLNEPSVRVVAARPMATPRPGLPAPMACTRLTAQRDSEPFEA